MLPHRLLNNLTFCLFRKGSVDVFSRMSFSLDELEGIVKTSYDEDTLQTDNAVKKTLKKKMEKAKTKEPLLKNAKVSTPTEQPKEGRHVCKT